MGRQPTNASLGLVEEKRGEMSFFLVRMHEAQDDEFAFRCFFSAFASAAMSVIYSLEAARDRIYPGFKEWLAPRRAHIMEQDPITRYVLSRRQSSVHWGETAVRSWRLRRDDGSPIREFYFALDPRRSEPVDVDVMSACEHTHNVLWDLVEEVAEAFPEASRDYLLDEAVMTEKGLSLEDVEESLGFPRGWSYIHGARVADRLAALRRVRPPVVAHPAYQTVLQRFDDEIARHGY